MTTDNHDDHDPRKKKPGNTNKPTRDAKGRWLKNYCPNPKGRPTKKPEVLPDQSDLRIFGNTIIDFVVNGEKEAMDRRTALINKMFESAMKGKVSAQRFLYEEFQRNDTQLATARAHYDQLMIDWIVNNPKFGKPDYDIPFKVEMEMLSLRALLNHYFPGQYPLDGVSANDDDDDYSG